MVVLHRGNPSRTAPAVTEHGPRVAGAGEDDPAGYLTLDQKRSLLLPKLNYLKVEK